jgi:hypothetical protein
MNIQTKHLFVQKNLNFQMKESQVIHDFIPTITATATTGGALYHELIYLLWECKKKTACICNAHMHVHMCTYVRAHVHVRVR